MFKLTLTQPFHLLRLSLWYVHNEPQNTSETEMKPFCISLKTKMTMWSFLLLSLISSVTFATDIPSRNKDLITATEEMQRANYFTFVMLINMAPPDLFQGNVTFLMPNDRTLSKTVFPETAMVDFLLHHSIPSPLLFDHLINFPTTSMIPTLKPETMLKVSNDGRKRFFLGNVRIISPNICTEGSSIRCHGIDQVVQVEDDNTTAPSPTCSSNGTVPSAPAPGPLPSPSPSVDTFNLGPSAPRKSGCFCLMARGRPLIGFLMTFLMLGTI